MEEEENFEISENNPEVRLGYGSHDNITFKGTISTGYSRREWDTLSEEEKNEVFDQTVWELVDLYELSDDDPDVC